MRLGGEQGKMKRSWKMYCEAERDEKEGMALRNVPKEGEWRKVMIEGEVNIRQENEKG